MVVPASTVAPRGVASGCPARTQKATCSSAARAFEDVARRRWRPLECVDQENFPPERARTLNRDRDAAIARLGHRPARPEPPESAQNPPFNTPNARKGFQARQMVRIIPCVARTFERGILGRSEPLSFSANPTQAAASSKQGQAAPTQAVDPDPPGEVISWVTQVRTCGLEGFAHVRQMFDSDWRAGTASFTARQQSTGTGGAVSNEQRADLSQTWSLRQRWAPPGQRPPSVSPWPLGES